MYFIFCDFDGTITNDDTLDYVISELYGYEKKNNLETELCGGMPYDKYLEHFNNIQYDINKINHLVDTTFHDFYQTHKDNFCVVSKGLSHIINHLVPYIEKEKLYCYQSSINASHYWNVNKQTPVNKKQILQDFRESHPDTFIYFIGDGISDFEVVGYADFLFVKKGSLLENFIIKNNPKILYECFNNFDEIKIKV